MNLYKKELLNHYRNPRNYGEIDNPTISSGEYIPSCGDSIQIQAIVTHGMIEKISFTGKGCILSQACASMLLENCYNKNIEEILLFNETHILNNLDISLGPTRLKCALLPLNALHKGICEYKNKKLDA